MGAVFIQLRASCPHHSKPNAMIDMRGNHNNRMCLLQFKREPRMMIFTCLMPFIIYYVLCSRTHCLPHPTERKRKINTLEYISPPQRKLYFMM